MNIITRGPWVRLSEGSTYASSVWVHAGLVTAVECAQGMPGELLCGVHSLGGGHTHVVSCKDQADVDAILDAIAAAQKACGVCWLGQPEVIRR